MLITMFPAAISTIDEGRQLAARFFGEELHNLPPHLVRNARSGDHGLVLQVRNGFAYLAHEALGQNAMLIAACPENQPDIAPGIYALVDDKGLVPYKYSNAPDQLRDHIADALASYRLMIRHAPKEWHNNDTQDTTSTTTEVANTEAVQLVPVPPLFSADDLDAIAEYAYTDDAEAFEQTEAAPLVREVRIAVALTPEHALALLSREYPEQDHAAKLASIQQGREAVDVLNHRVMLDYSPSQQRYLGILHPDDKAELDETLSSFTPDSATTHETQVASILPGKPGKEIEP